jgi:tetratricopeptide (TPR) repeat protein
MQNTEQFIAQGNTYREQHQPELALQQYATAMVNDRGSSAAFNNYGNVIREMGYPERAQPFLEHAVRIDSKNETARFNLAVCYLLQGNYQQGWPAYEDRWNFEHLKGVLPDLPRPRWTGQDLKNKTIEYCINDVKLTSELLAIEYSQMFDFPGWINRCGVIAGPGQFGKIDQGVFSYWIYSWLRKNKLKLDLIIAITIIN